MVLLKEVLFFVFGLNAKSAHSAISANGASGAFSASSANSAFSVSSANSANHAFGANCANCAFSAEPGSRFLDPDFWIQIPDSRLPDPSSPRSESCKWCE